MADDGTSDWRDHARLAPWPKLLGRSVAGGVACLVSSRLFDASPSDAAWAGIGATIGLLAVQAGLVLRDGPDAIDEEANEKSPEDDYKPPLFGNG